MKEAFPVKLQTENLFLLKIKMKQKTQSPKIRNVIQSLSTFIRISGPIPEVKKTIALINNWEDVATYWQ